MTINFSNINSAANEIWTKLDAKDQNQDSKIQKDIWNTFADIAGGKHIKSYIERPNALRSIRYYLQKANDEVRTKILNYLGISTDQELSQNDDSAAATNTTNANSIYQEKDEYLSNGNKSNEESLRGILNQAGLQVTDEEFPDILAKYETKLALKDQMGYTNESIAYDIINYVNAKQKYNPVEDKFAEAERAESIVEKANLSEQAIANPYIIEGVKEAAEKGDFKAHAEAYQRFGNGQVQLYDKDGDNKINKNEFIAYEEQRAGGTFSEDEKQVAEKLFDYLKNTQTEDEYIDVDEMTLHQYAASKIFDNENSKTGKDITFLEWKATNDALTEYVMGNKDNPGFQAYEGWRDMGKQVIYNYEEILKQQSEK